MTYYPDAKYDTLTFENTLGKTQWVWDALNRQTENRRYKTASIEDTWTLGYPQGRWKNIATVSDDLSKTTTTVLDDLGRKNRVTTPESGVTLYVYDAGSRLASVVEAKGSAGEQTHTFTFDALGRRLTENYSGACSTFTPPAPPEVEYTWDTISCPGGATSCANTAGRLARVRVVLYCDTAQADGSIQQDTYIGFDAAGRLTNEFITDDVTPTPRTASQAYAYDENGNMTHVTTPSGVSAVYTFGGAGNSDANLMTTLARDNGSSTNLLTSITWMPFGPVASYDQANTISSVAIHAALSWNLGYRTTEIRYTAGAANRTEIDYTEDERGRYTSKVYSNTANPIDATYLKYDWLDRITCDATVSGACPTSGATLRTNVTSIDASNDRRSFYHRDPAIGDTQYTNNYYVGTDKLVDYTPASIGGSIVYGWDDRGNRTYEDNSASIVDRRDYTYDGRRRVRTITGKFRSGTIISPVMRDYAITEAYDHRDRRVMRTFQNTSQMTPQQQWYFYYDPNDRLIEVKWIPSVAAPSAYLIYQWYYVGDRPVAYFATDVSAGTTARYFIHADDTDRPLEVFSWPTAPTDGTAVWASRPDAFGWDRLGLPQSISYQPLRSGGAYFDDLTQAWADTTWIDRPQLLTAYGAAYDPQSATSLQVRGRWPDEAYSSADFELGTKLNTTPVERHESLPSVCMSPGQRSNCGGCGPTTPSIDWVAQQSDGGTGGGSPGGCTVWYCDGHYGCKSVPRGFAVFGAAYCHHDQWFTTPSMFSTGGCKLYAFRLCYSGTNGPVLGPVIF